MTCAATRSGSGFRCGGRIGPQSALAVTSAPTAREFVLAIIAGDTERVRKLRAAGASVTEADQYGWQPIHRAAANDRDEIIRLLVEWGSPLEATGTESWTPLHLASASRSDRAVAALLRAGANVHARSSSGATPLHLAIGLTVTPGSLETVCILMAAGSNPNAADHQSRSPLDRAREIGDPALLTALRERAT